jgi:hypothetical protein
MRLGYGEFRTLTFGDVMTDHFPSLLDLNFASRTIRNWTLVG